MMTWHRIYSTGWLVGMTGKNKVPRIDGMVDMIDSTDADDKIDRTYGTSMADRTDRIYRSSIAYKIDRPDTYS